jgi:3-oxoacyl-[acyl-carrier protein] reductase
MTDLTGKIAVVTGGSRGIGAAVAKKLGSMGADVAILDLGDGEIAAEVCAEITAMGRKAKGYRCNVADFNETKAVVDAIKADFGGVHILVNNAGITRDKLIPMMKEEDFDSVIGVNLKGAFNMIRHCSMLMVKAKFGRIINISSVAGLMGNPGQANYSASKAALIGLTKTTAKEFAKKGVTANAIAPGFIQTSMTENLGDNKLMEEIPVGHMGTVEDIAEAAAYLASAPYVTGEVIRVDGGIAM